MTVYVDDMHKYSFGRYRGMRMSHMIADTDDELFAMVDKIGVNRKWYQGDHFDICLSKRALAVKHGAIEVTTRELAAMSFCKRAGRMYKSPADALVQLRACYKERANGTQTVKEEVKPPRTLQGGKRKVRV